VVSSGVCGRTGRVGNGRAQASACGAAPS
jgi:hypothetical protein